MKGESAAEQACTPTITGRRIAVIGLGYVGLPVALALARLGAVVGFDINPERVAALARGHDVTGESAGDEIRAANVHFTSDPADLAAADFFVVAVPTPLAVANQPDFAPLLAASRTVGAALKPGDIVVYESTVYPGTTEELCIPVLEAVSGLRFGQDFGVGYSPERINPGDRDRRFSDIRKVVSGSDAATLEVVAGVYGAVVSAGIYRAASIRVAEAAKVIENTQRDLNIALMNELAVLCHRLGIDTQDVLEAAGTKWNFLPFRPGLVGGHCISVDPYYLTHKAEALGYVPQVILAGRRINDAMGRFVAQEVIKQMILSGHPVAESTVTVLGITFKENCPDIRNTKVADLIAELRSYGCQVQVCDPVADPEETACEYGIALEALPVLRPAAAVVVAVAHDVFRALSPDALRALAVDSPAPILADVKGLFDRKALAAVGFRIWRL